MRFEWNRGKADTNFRKHGVSFDEAVTAFYDPLAATLEDPDHSIGERRFITIGYSSIGRLPLVVHSERNVTLRIISARPASAKERKRHET